MIIKDQIVYNYNYRMIHNIHKLIYFGKLDSSNIVNILINMKQSGFITFTSVIAIYDENDNQKKTTFLLDHWKMNIKSYKTKKFKL